MSTIKSNMIHGVFWSAIEKYSGMVVGLIISMVLARILTPNEYGVVAIASVIIAFMQIFCTMGIAPAIIQRQDLEQRDYDNIFTFSIIIGASLSLICILLAKPIAVFYDNEQLVNVCRLLSLELFFASLNMVPNALMTKNLRFREIAVRTLILQILSGIVGIVMALNGAGIYALIMPGLITSFFIFLYNKHFYPVKVIFRFSLQPIKKIFSYSIYQFLFSVINYFTGNLDKLIIGKFISADALGYYEKSYRLMQLPLQNVTSVISPVLHPVLTHLQDDLSDMANKYNRVVGIIATFSFPVAIILFFTGSEIVRVVYGNNWDLAIPTLRILALSLPTHMILSTSGSIWQACNYTKYLFWVGLLNTFVVVSGYFISAFMIGTLESIAWAWTITALLNFIFTYAIMYKLVLHSSIFTMFKRLFSPLCNALLLLLIYYGFNKIYPGVNSIVDLITKGLIGLLVSLVYLHLTGKFDTISFIKKQLNNRNHIK